MAHKFNLKHIRNNKNNYIKLKKDEIRYIINEINDCPNDIELKDLQEYLKIPYTSDSEF